MNFMSGAQFVIINEVVNGKHCANNTTASDSISGAVKMVLISLIAPAVVWAIMTIFPNADMAVAFAVVIMGLIVTECVNWCLYQIALNTISYAKKVKTKMAYALTAIFLGVFMASPVIALAYSWNDSIFNYLTIALVAILAGCPLLGMIGTLWRVCRYKTRH